jgi:hypothetical protein
VCQNQQDKVPNVKGINNLEACLRGNDMSKLANEKGLNSLEVGFRGSGYDMSVLLKLSRQS